MSTGIIPLLRNGYIRTVLMSTLFSQTGIWIRNFAVLLDVAETTGGDALAVSMISVAEYAPIFAFSFVGGVFADRWRPKRTIVWCECLSSLSVFAVFALLEAGAWRAVFLAAFCSSALSQFALPSGMKLFKNCVRDEEATAAMSLLQTLTSVFMVIGPILGTLAYERLGMDVSVLATGACFLLSAVALTFVPPDPKPSNASTNRESPAPSLLREMRDGIRYVWANKTLLKLTVCFTLVGFGAGWISPLGIFLVTERLGLPPEAVQWISIPYGAGEVIGGIATFALAAQIAPRRLLMIGLLVDGIGIVLAGLSPVLWLTMTAQFAIALLQPAIFVGNNALVMMQVDPAYIGRVMGIRTPLMTGAMLLAMSAAGVAAKTLSLPVVYALAGICFVGGFGLLLPLHRREDRGEPTEIG
ncbi:MFS transporter [Cohnella xylanilytica]|uniref:MFS transporter n=1 Tax=Cohnella xylanilytica TaxID=557555 RepID=A0A841U8A5_9BACL|nr:MFS transporter [Cohnella xylanilytica]MBB6694251.1 MFS transporter [Cohnella xylanilytica]GIO13503.1 MFS transporter [Cohnella xylanilytica]